MAMPMPHIRPTLTALGLLVFCLSGCGRKPEPKQAPSITVTTGILDWSGWQKWIQEPPRLVLTDQLDGETQRLVNEQTKLFVTLVTEPKTPVAKAPDQGQRLETLKTAFLNNSYNQQTLTYPSGNETYLNAYGEVTYRTRTTNINIPHLDRWSRYQGIVRSLQLSNLATSIISLERQSGYDLQDLGQQRNSGGPVGVQARADTDWINGTLTPFLNQLKAIETPPAGAPSGHIEQARQRWQGFETNELVLIKRVIGERTLAETVASPDGAFSLQGRGQLCAVIKVAGRELFFPAGTRVDGLRFINVQVGQAPASE